MSHPVEWMFGQIKVAAGIHMSTFKDTSDDGAPVAEPTAEESELNPNIAGWTPSPSWMAQMAASDKTAGV